MQMRHASENGTPLRRELAAIAEMIVPGSLILDVGCGDGALLDYLSRHKQVDGRGIELDQAKVNACVRRGLSVVQGDADKDLAEYPTDGFDYVVLSQTLQATRNPAWALEELVRIGRRAIVSIPNFAYVSIRLSLFFRGAARFPDSGQYEWFNTPNIHHCSIRDFHTLCRERHIAVEQAWAIRGNYSWLYRRPGPLTNLFGREALFLLRRETPHAPAYSSRDQDGQ